MIVLVSLGIAIAFVAIMLLLYVVFEKAWVKKHRYTTFKYLFLTVVIVACLLLRVIFVAILDGHNGDLSIESWKDSFIAIYSSLGSLSFDGQPDSEVAAISIVYHATGFAEASLLAIIVTLNVSYPLYSTIRLKFKRKSDRDVYVFSAITDDTINLANDISNKKKDNCVIIFVNDESIAFDGKEELHRRIREMRYFFINSIDATKNDSVSILKRLGLANKNRKGEIHFLAMNTNEKKVGLETENSKIVLDEIAALKNLKNSAPIFKKTHFYVLTNNTVDYEFYDSKLEELKVKNANLKIINEASLVGLDLSEQRSIMEIKRIQETGLINGGNLDVAVPERDYTAYVFGFGQTGQKALDNLFVDVSSLFVDPKMKDSTDYKNKYLPRGFVAKVFDAYINNISSIYAKQHPSYIFYTQKRGIVGVDKEEEITKEGYVSINLANIKAAYGDNYQNVANRMKFPKIFLSNQNVKDIEFPTIDFAKVDAVIVCLGNDEDNIEVSNTLLKELRQQIVLNKKKDIYLEVFVNIANSSNNKRVTSLKTTLMNNENADLFKNISVITFGNLDTSEEDETKSVYSYDKIIDETESKIFERIYDYGTPFDDKEKEYKIAQSIRLNSLADDDKTNKNEKTCKKIDARLAVKNGLSKEKVWARHYRRLSSSYAAAFVDYYYYYYLNKFKNNTRDMFINLFDVEYSEEDETNRYLAQLEHVRWCRFTMMYGCIYVSNYPVDNPTDGGLPQEVFTKAEEQKEYCKMVTKIHNCLLPYGKNGLPDYLEKYDYFNVYLGALLQYRKLHAKD